MYVGAAVEFRSRIISGEQKPSQGTLETSGMSRAEAPENCLEALRENVRVCRGPWRTRHQDRRPREAKLRTASVRLRNRHRAKNSGNGGFASIHLLTPLKSRSRSRRLP